MSARRPVIGGIGRALSVERGRPAGAVGDLGGRAVVAQGCSSSRSPRYRPGARTTACWRRPGSCRSATCSPSTCGEAYTFGLSEALVLAFLAGTLVPWRRTERQPADAVTFAGSRSRRHRRVVRGPVRARTRIPGSLAPVHRQLAAVPRVRLSDRAAGCAALGRRPRVPAARAALARGDGRVLRHALALPRAAVALAPRDRRRRARRRPARRSSPGCVCSAPPGRPAPPVRDADDHRAVDRRHPQHQPERFLFRDDVARALGLAWQARGALRALWIAAAAIITSAAFVTKSRAGIIAWGAMAGAMLARRLIRRLANGRARRRGRRRRDHGVDLYVNPFDSSARTPPVDQVPRHAGQGAVRMIEANPVFGVGIRQFRLRFPEYRPPEAKEIDYLEDDPHNHLLGGRYRARPRRPRGIRLVRRRRDVAGGAGVARASAGRRGDRPLFRRRGISHHRCCRTSRSEFRWRR